MSRHTGLLKILSAVFLACAPGGLLSQSVVGAIPKAAVAEAVGWPTYGVDRFQSHRSPYDIEEGTTLTWSYTSTAGFAQFGHPVLIDASNLAKPRLYAIEHISAREDRIVSIDAKTGKIQWTRKIPSGFDSCRLTPHRELAVTVKNSESSYTTLLFSLSAGRKPPKVRWERTDEDLAPLRVDALLPGSSDGFLMLTSPSINNNGQRFMGLNRRGREAWSFDLPQPGALNRQIQSLALGSDGRVYLSGSAHEGDTWSKAFLQVLDLPSVGGPGERQVISVPSVFCEDDPVNTYGGPLLLSPSMSFAAQVYKTVSPECAPVPYYGLVLWDLTTTPYDHGQIFNAPDLKLSTDAFGGLAYTTYAQSSEGRAREHVLAGTTNGRIIDIDVGHGRATAIGVAGPLESLTTPVVSADRYLIVGDSSGVASIIDLTSEPEPFVTACVALPTGTRIETQPTEIGRAHV